MEKIEIRVFSQEGFKNGKFRFLRDDLLFHSSACFDEFRRDQAVFDRNGMAGDFCRISFAIYNFEIFEEENDNS